MSVHWQGGAYPGSIAAFFAKPYPDLALLQIVLQEHPCVYPDPAVRLGDPLYSYGYTDDYPGGDSATFEYEGPTGNPQELLKLKEGQVRPGLSGAPLLNRRTGTVCGIVKRTRDRTSDLGGRAVLIAVIFQAIHEIADRQREFHRQDTRWLDHLDFPQRERLAGQIAPLANPFYGESPQLVGREPEVQCILEKLRAGNHCSIVGPPGSGKSFLLKAITRRIPTGLGWSTAEICVVNFRVITRLHELQEAVAFQLGGHAAKELRSLLHSRPLRLLIVDDLGGMDPGARGLTIRQWLRGLGDVYGSTKLFLVSNERLDGRFRKDNPNRDSPLAGLDPLPVELGPLAPEAGQRIIKQRLAGTPFSVASFSDLLQEALQPRDLLNRYAVRYEQLRWGRR